ncbi:hypothetical protein Q1695_004350 [Nippostrongylus brasiliensis]|nr:hypothetical protein Q1695_004350 [Nippostrongylus brasiliensis]
MKIEIYNLREPFIKEDFNNASQVKRRKMFVSQLLFSISIILISEDAQAQSVTSFDADAWKLYANHSLDLIRNATEVAKHTEMLHSQLLFFSAVLLTSDFAEARAPQKFLSTVNTTKSFEELVEIAHWFSALAYLQLDGVQADIVGNNKENVEETDRMDRNKDNIQKIEMLCSQIKSISLEIAKKPDACDVLDDVVVNMQQIYQQLAARTEQQRRTDSATVEKSSKKSNHDLSSSY